MKGNPFLGVGFFFQGIKLILTPGLKRYILVPFFVNLFLMITIIVGFAWYISHHLTSILQSYPEWLILILGWLFWILYAIISLLLGTLLFTILTNLIASPFYGLLSEAVEQRNSSNANLYPSTLNLKEILILWAKTFTRELRKILYFIPWLLLCLGFLIFPLTWILFPWVWWAIMAWIMAIQYCDYAADNQKIPLKEMIAELKKAPLTVLGFGGVVSIMMTIPVFNLIAPAAAVAGGTLLWLSLKHKRA